MPKIEFAKPAFDVGFATSALEAHRDFWANQVGLEYDHMAKLGGGFHQHRWRQGQSIVKVNHSRAPLPETPAGGYRGLVLAREADMELATPDGVAVRLAPDPEVDLRLRVVANDLDAFDRFYGEGLGLEAAGPHAFRLGRSEIAAVAGTAPRIDDWRARGLRYMTVQIFDCDGLTAALGRMGVPVGKPPGTVGQVRYSFVRDDDGNWIELSERASLTGRPVKPD